ncbi:MAG: winged helix family transcriptional regulator [Chitinophagaceae bacterium]|nr:MAG: winged helix family transcriptional regulator [Chitinophagaceae bacterium]
MLTSGREAVVPCLGRDQPARPYQISIRFRPEAPFWTRNRLLGAGAAVLALCLAGAGIRRRPGASTKTSIEKEPYPDVPDAGLGLQPTVPPAPATNASVTAASPTAPAPEFLLGRYRFLPGQQCLLLEEERIPLTGKEASLLHLFAARPNEVIDRAELQKIWDDEGVIVGRSLDVFVSRLRKKLESDPGIAIVNVPRKGYRLEVTG